MGKVLLVTGPTASSDARLRRAQALARQSGAAVEIMRELMRAKVSGQEELARNKLKDLVVADVIGRVQERLCSAESLDVIAQLESQAAYYYWSA
jgi:CRISPR/Cas system-associated endonuclease Cas1